ncbi:MAG TPA: DUF5996 family protein [Gemmatimonadaceae bacterium]|nr:DUF5996 family protein [Gemmatimonadaceae bacterium]
MTATSRGDAWPPLPLDEWRDSYATLHLYSQIVGKTRLALAPIENHWWEVVLYVTSRGLTTSPMPLDRRAVQVDFDFVDHQLLARTSDGASASFALVPRTVADFYDEYMKLLDGLGVAVKIWPVPVELPEVIPFAKDREHRSYDPDAVNRFWRVLVQSERVMRAFRAKFMGKASPVQFFWGSFDLAATRFSGRSAPPHPGGAPNVGDWVMREAYSRELSSAGFWPGSGPVEEPAYYSYAYPEPAGFADALVTPEAAYYDGTMREFILPYEAVRLAASPDETLMEFLQSTYDAAANLGKWDRAALERSPAELKELNEREKHGG